MGGTYFLQLLHSRLVCLLPAEHIGSVAVAELCVCVSWGALFPSTAERVVLLGYVLGEVGRNHLFDLCGGILVDEGIVLVGVCFPLLSSAVSNALGKTFVIVTKHQSRMGIVCAGRAIAQDVRMLRNGRAP